MKMITVEVSKTKGLALNWALGVALGLSPELTRRSGRIYWSESGSIVHSSDTWNPEADDVKAKQLMEEHLPGHKFSNAEAVCRAIAISKRGETVLVPEALTITQEESAKPTEIPAI